MNWQNFYVNVCIKVVALQNFYRLPKLQWLSQVVIKTFEVTPDDTQNHVTLVINFKPIENQVPMETKMDICELRTALKFH